ncbi:MAG TPA: hypothetical protein VF678_13880, partial [bacterium]
MNSIRIGMVAMAFALLGVAGTAWAQAKLVAPLYPGAKPVDADTAKHCVDSTKYSGEICGQYTADSMDKVQAFYEGKVGKRFQPPRSAKGESHRWAPLAWEYYTGEDGVGDEFHGVLLRSRAVAAWPEDAMAARQVMVNSTHFSEIAAAVNWALSTAPQASAVYMQGGHTVQDLKALYAKWSYLEGRYFGDPIALRDLKDKYKVMADKRLEQARAQVEQKRQQEGAAQQKRMQDMMSQQQARQQEVARGGNADEQADKAEMEAMMKRKPGLWARAKPSYDKGQALMNEGMKTMDEAKLNQAEVEMKKANDILRTDPEVAALQDKQMARADARAKSQAQSMMKGQPTLAGMQASTQANNKALSDAVWDTWTAYLAEAAKLASYPTRVDVGHAIPGEGKERSSKADVVAQKLSKFGSKV